MPEFIEPDDSLSEVEYGEAPISYPDSEAWKYQIDSTDVLEELAHHLRGEFRSIKRVKDINGQLVEETSWDKKGKALLNEEGIRFIITVIGGHLSKVSILTDIDEDQINRMAREIYIDLSNHLSIHYKEYESIEFPLDTTSLTLLVTLIDHYIYSNLARGMGGRFLNYLKPTIRRVEYNRPQQEEKKKSLWPF